MHGTCGNWPCLMSRKKMYFRESRGLFKSCLRKYCIQDKFQLLGILVVSGFWHLDLYQSSIDKIWCTAICKFWSHDNIFSHINSSWRTLFQVLKPNLILDLMTFINFFLLSWQPVSTKTLALLSHPSLLVMKKQRHCWEWNSLPCNLWCNTLQVCHGLFLFFCCKIKWNDFRKNI